MNIKTVDCAGPSKENLIRLVTELVTDGWLDPSVVERTVFSAQMELGQLNGATFHVGSYMEGLAEAGRQGLLDSATVVETQGILGHLDHDDYLVMVDAKAPHEEAIKSVLVHELVHVKQYMDKRLVNMATEAICWEGQMYPAPTGEVNLEYFTTPWEREAFDAQARYESQTLGMSEAEVKSYYLRTVQERSV